MERGVIQARKVGRHQNRFSLVWLCLGDIVMLTQEQLYSGEINGLFSSS